MSGGSDREHDYGPAHRPSPARPPVLHHIGLGRAHKATNEVPPFVRTGWLSDHAAWLVS